jgi:hypothetical protein
VVWPAVAGVQPTCELDTETLLDITIGDEGSRTSRRRIENERVVFMQGMEGYLAEVYAAAGDGRRMRMTGPFGKKRP